MWRRASILIVVVSVLLLSGAAQAAQDVTGPFDTVEGVPNDGVTTGGDNNGWPPNELPPFAFDDQVLTKYLHFKGNVEPTGLRITPVAGATVVTGLSFTTANDAAPRDPAEYELSGSNDSINGPWTLIAAGPIVDFAGGAAWPRRTKNTTPIWFENEIAYEHYQIMFPVIRDAPNANSMQIAEIELLVPSLKASTPSPADGAVGVVMPLLQWQPGDVVLWHDVYFGETPNLGDGDFQVRNPQTVLMYYHMAPLTPGQTYYWRVDQVEPDGTVHTGDVWSFQAVPLNAYAPSPADGAKWLDLPITLSWFPGGGAQSHDVYFGTDRALVEARDASVSKGNQFGTTFDPGALAENTTYYWLVDEHASGGAFYEGQVWTFTTVGPGGGLKGEYFGNVNLSGAPALTRIDPDVNFNWAAESPGAPIPADGWSARWTADLEIVSADTYTFHVNSQDGTRLWIDGELVLDMWVAWVTTEYGSLPTYLEKGIHSLRLEYFDSGGDAVQQLYWSTPTMAKTIIPAGPLQPPVRASGPRPADKATDVKQDPILSWSAGLRAAQHDVFFGTDEQAVADATTTSGAVYKGRQDLDDTSYVPGSLAWDATYYWKISEVNGADVVEGSVWSFTTSACLIVEDFEDYNDFTNRIFYNWIDGFGYTTPPPGNPGNGTNSTVGNIDPPFAETTITHGGSGQALVMEYNNAGNPWISEADRTFAGPQNWTVNDVKALVVWYRGLPASTGGFSYDAGTGTYTVTGYGWDIWGTDDEFLFVYKTLNGNGSITARMDSIEDVHDWAKAGVMIRNTLDSNSEYAFTHITPTMRVAFQRRVTAGTNAEGTNSDEDTITLPHWVQITREGNTLTGQHSSDGVSWQDVVEPGDPSLPTAISIPGLNPTVYIGLAVTSHVSINSTGTAEFSNVTTTGGVAPGVFTDSADVVPARTFNANEPMYLVIESGAQTALLKNPDPNALNQTDYKPWHIPLTDITAKGVTLTGITKMTIGVGNKETPAVGGKGTLYVDDIRVCGSMCVPSKAQPLADFDDNCLVDYLDLDTMVGEWLDQADVDTTLTTDVNADDVVDLADFAILGDEWMELITWP